MIKNKKVQCPVCATSEKPSKLVLKQINVDTAVYLCSKRSCPYPQGHKWVTVSRSLEQMLSDTQKKVKKKKKLNVNKFLDKLICAPMGADSVDIMNDLNGIKVEDDDNQDVSLLDCDILNQTELCNEFNLDELIDEFSTPNENNDDCKQFDFNEFIEGFPVEAPSHNVAQNSDSKVIVLEQIIFNN